jgi:transcriptional regulator with XRE-family HTH domain
VKAADYASLVDWTAFGHLVATLRKSHGYSQAELAARCQIDNSYISQIEHGKRANVSLDIISKLARALHIKPAFLMFLSITSDREDKVIDDAQKHFQQIIRQRAGIP